MRLCEFILIVHEQDHKFDQFGTISVEQCSLIRTFKDESGKLNQIHL